MFLMHPVSLAISLASALVYAVYLNGRRAVRFSLLYMLPMMVVAALVNPAFNHEGATILTYLPSGNPLTLESILYGAAAAAMLAAVVTWFSCYTAVMTSDKFVYLFGRVIPALSLVLSMTLRFVPKFQAQLQVVSEAQRCIGRDVSNGGVLRRLRNAITILSIMVTWSLESAIETADSMKGPVGMGCLDGQHFPSTGLTAGINRHFHGCSTADFSSAAARRQRAFTGVIILRREECR